MTHSAGTTLGEIVRNERIRADLSLRELARRVAISPSYLSDIENDRRIPSEDVMRELAGVLSLNFDDLMARGGRVGDDAERYIKQNPTAGVLFRRISDKRLPESQLKRLLKEVEKMPPPTDEE